MRLMNGGRALGRCILVSRLSTVLKGIANDKVSKGGNRSCSGGIVAT